MADAGSSNADLSARLAQLSPERRALLEQKLRAMAAPLRGEDGSTIKRRADQGLAPLTYAQEFLWLLERAYPGLAAYNVPRAFRVHGPVDIPALETALTDLVDRHEVLRTRLLTTTGSAVQTVAPTEPVLIERAFEPDDHIMRAHLSEHARRPFDLERDQLLRAVLIDVSPDESIFQMVVHHVAADGWSRNVTLRDLSACYAARLRGEAPSLPPLPIGYADYAAWQRSEKTATRVAKELAHWRDALAGAPEVLDLPADRPRSGAPTFEGARVFATVPTETLEGLKAVARAEGASLFMVLLAAYGVLLHRHTGQTDMLVGSPIAGRAATETHDLVGLFANTLVLRVQCDGDPTFSDLVGRVRRVCLDAFEHQDLPFELLADELQRERTSGAGLVQTLFSLHDAAPAQLALTGAQLEVVDFEPGWSKVDLTLAAMERADGLHLLSEFRTDLFERATVERLLEHFEVLLDSVVANPRRTVSSLPIFTERERAEILVASHGPRSEHPPTPVHEIVEAQVDATPNAVAVTDAHLSLTYAELDSRANRLAEYLREQGVAPGNAVGICLPRTSELVVALLAVLKAGAHYVPLDPEYPADRLAFILEDSRAGVVVVASDTRSRLPLDGVRAVALDEVAEAIAACSSTRPGIAVPPESLAYVLHTSGSTGRPKGVMIPHRAVSNFLRSMAKRPGLSVGDAVVAVTTLSFDIAGLELWLPLTVGARITIASRAVTVDGHALAQLVDDTAAAVKPGRARAMLQATPATWRLLLDAGWKGTPGLRMLCGGEAWPPELAAELINRGESLWNVYGPTETTIWSSVAHVSSASTILLGRPIANTSLLVLDANRALAPAGAAGELYIGGDGVAVGYLNRPDLTAERFVDDAFAPGKKLYRTGDLVRRRTDGELEYLGRIDQQVKIRGFRIELGEVESVLTALPGVTRAVATARPNARGEVRLVAYVIPADPASPPAADALRTGMRHSLPEHMTPTSYVMLEAFPLTPNGKIDRRALPEPGSGDTAARADAVAPRTPLEAQIAEVWSSVLGVSGFGVEDDFFALGGHSLLAMRVVARLAGALPVRITIGSLFEARTVAALATVVERQLAETQAVPGFNAVEHVSPREGDGPAPLSHAQELLWLYEQMTPGTAAYNMPVLRRVRGPLDAELLRRAIEGLVERHESLRTTFIEIDGVPKQVVGAPAPVVIGQHDLRGLAAEERDEEAGRIMREDAARPFDLAAGTTPRVTLVRVADDEALLVIVVHHVVFDGGSIVVLLRELAVTYDALARGTSPDLPALPLQLADHATWERRTLDGERLAPSLAFWREYLGDAPAGIDLPTDFPRPATTTGPGGRCFATLPVATRDAVHRLATTQEVTPFMVMLAAFQTLLHRYSGQADLVVGTPTAGRSRPGTEGIVGYLANTLALRARFDDDPTFAELLRQLRVGTLRAFDHQDVSYEKLVRELRTGLPVSEQALFRVMFTQQEAQATPTRLGDASLETVGMDLGVAKFDLMLSAAEVAEGIRVVVEFRRDLFQSDTITRLLRHLQVLIAAADAAPHTRVSALALMECEEREQVLWGWNGTDVAYPPTATLVHLLDEQAARTPDAIAVEDEQGVLTFAQLDAAAAALARRLRDMGVDRGALVGVCAERSVELVVALIAVVKAGAAYVPLDPDYPADRLAFMLEDADVRVLLTQRRLAETLPALGACRAPIVVLDGAADAGDAGAPLPLPSADDAAYMIYTSGSTGRPKGALNAHRGIVNRLLWMQSEYGLTAADVVLQKTPFSFDVSVWEFFWPLMTGAKLVMARPGGHRDAAYLAEVVAQRGVTVCHFVPSMLRAFLADGAASRCGTLRDVMASGEALTPDLVAGFYTTLPNARLHNLYGPTECAVDVSYWPCPPSVVPPPVVPIGRPVANTRLYVLDARSVPTPIGVPGELYLAGVQVGMGYHNRPDLTAERFVPDPFSSEIGVAMYKTGDRARWRADGTVEYLGRLDFQVKVRGVRIELGEVETALLAEPGVSAAVAVVRTDVERGDSLVAYVVPTAGAALVPRALVAALARNLPEAMLPSAIVVLDAMPLSPSGKIDRRSLPAPIFGVTDETLVEPRDDVEAVIAGVWREVLGRERVGVETRFFDLGGHSLLATRVVAQVTKIFRARLTLRRFFDEPTVAGIARILVADEAKQGQTASIAALLRKLQSMSPAERDAFRKRQSRSDETVGIR